MIEFFFKKKIPAILSRKFSKNGKGKFKNNYVRLDFPALDFLILVR